MQNSASSGQSPSQLTSMGRMDISCFGAWVFRDKRGDVCVWGGVPSLQSAMVRNESSVSVIKQTDRQCWEEDISYVTAGRESLNIVCVCVCYTDMDYQADIPQSVKSVLYMVSFLSDHTHTKTWGCFCMFCRCKAVSLFNSWRQLLLWLCLFGNLLAPFEPHCVTVGFRLYDIFVC